MARPLCVFTWSLHTQKQPPKKTTDLMPNAQSAHSRSLSAHCLWHLCLRLLPRRPVPSVKAPDAQVKVCVMEQNQTQQDFFFFFVNLLDRKRVTSSTLNNNVYFINATTTIKAILYQTNCSVCSFSFLRMHNHILNVWESFHFTKLVSLVMASQRKNRIRNKICNFSRC